VGVQLVGSQGVGGGGVGRVANGGGGGINLASRQFPCIPCCIP